MKPRTQLIAALIAMALTAGSAFAAAPPSVVATA